MSILTACEPRKDILTGTFNPEIFTASLSQVLRFYRGEATGIHSIYTNAQEFFSEATYPTEGMKMVLADVFGRLHGDNSLPAIHRLETAFGGGKTHTLIACTHLAHKGTELAGDTRDILDSNLLPTPGEITVVGIAGDEIPVHKPQGTALVPYTLWGEIAYQVGGEALYRQVEPDAVSHAAPGRNYFDAVLKGRKVLIMLDELAQYAARLTAARAEGGNQLAAFLMALHGYARDNAGIAIVLTLASVKDAFAYQTIHLAELLAQVMGRRIGEDEAMGIGREALAGVTSVVMRDASSVVPVQAAEISRVLGKRLFTRIDKTKAEETVNQYKALYQKNMSELPPQATQSDYWQRMIDHYPFHPTLIDFLNHKLATAEEFQGTRGVLRVLAHCVRDLWKKKAPIPMIHACHINLRDSHTANELTGRTGSGDLIAVLNADIGGVDTQGIEGGKSNAALADLRNPHPDGIPMYEYTWKTIFLHSLVGRESGLTSQLFGLNKQDALFAITFPGLSPSQVSEALKEIENSAFYLRLNQGRYYASLDPSINIAVAKIRKTLSVQEIDDRLEITARKVVDPGNRIFTVVTDVKIPEHIPDKKGKPVLALVSLNAGRIDIEECVTTTGKNSPRVEQNLVFLLVPETVSTRKAPAEETLFGQDAGPAEKALDNLRGLARTLLAMQKLSANPHAYSINPKRLEDDNFQQRYKERDLALLTAVSQCYKTFWFPSTSGQIVRKEIHAAVGEGGEGIFEQIHKMLLEDGELVTADHDTQSHLTSLAKIFFARGDVIEIQKIRENFCQIRSWPILESPVILDTLIRAGVSKGIWCLFRMGSEQSTKPEVFHSRETGELPLALDLSGDYSLVTQAGAHQRGWIQKEVTPSQVLEWVKQTTRDNPVIPIAEIRQAITGQHGEVPQKLIDDGIVTLAQKQERFIFQGTVDQVAKPAELIKGAKATLYNPRGEDIVITPAKAAERGWTTGTGDGGGGGGGGDSGDEIITPLNLTGNEGAGILLPMLRQIGSLYNRGGKCTVNELDLTELVLPQGGTLQIKIMDAPPASMKDLGELFEVIAGLVKPGDQTEAFLAIDDPLEDCPFVKEIRRQQEQRG